LKLNGKEREIEAVETVDALITSLGIHRMIVVEHNGSILRKEQFEDTKLTDGDTIEIVHMVGGG